MTAQIADRILIEGQEFGLFSEPLNEYLTRANISFTAPNTALWRGYIARWEVADSQLFLLGVWGQACTVQVDEAAPTAECHRKHGGQCVVRGLDLRDLFPGSNGRVFADWVSGRLRIPQGKLLEYVHMGFESIYQRYLLLDVDHGVVKNTTIAETPQSKWWTFWK